MAFHHYIRKSGVRVHGDGMRKEKRGERERERETKTETETRERREASFFEAKQS